MTSRTGLIAVALVIGLSAGCSRREAAADPETAEKQGRLQEVFDLVTAYTEQRKRPPAADRDLRPFENAFPTGFDAVRTGQIVVLWGASPAAGSDAVLAYYKTVPAEGGWVLLQNGTVKEMAPDEFGKTPKAGK
ncbi:MAG: hypothetical protein JWO38_4166 [Gemmataceae bacterium]|nr:hypothetical protein [Gemmataceae bacterium]